MSSTEQQAPGIERTDLQQHNLSIPVSSTSNRLPTPEGSGAVRWLAEQAPEQMLAALRDFLTPNRESRGGLR